MSLKTHEFTKIGKAEQKFRDAFERLKIGKTEILPKGTIVSQNNVAKEAGVDPSALRRTRFPALVAEIQEWIEQNKQVIAEKSPRQMLLAQRSRSRNLRERIDSLTMQRDMALSKLVDAQARIVELTLENDRLRAQFPISNIKKF